MIDIVIGAPDYQALKRATLGDDAEHCAVLTASQVTRSDGRIRLLVRAVDTPLPEDYAEQSAGKAELKPDYVARVSKRAKRESLSLVFVHNHLNPAPPEFSPIDDHGEFRLAAFLSHRCPGQVHGAIVLSEGGATARRLGTNQGIRVVVVGDTIEHAYDPNPPRYDLRDRHDRQIRAFGVAGQMALEGLTIAIVGLGGTGSIVAQQLAHLGVKKFILIDPDVIETTNLNRVVGAVHEDLHQPKVIVAARFAKEFCPEADITPIQGDIIYARVARKLIDADLIFGCTDSHGSRAILQQVSYQYLIPCIDTGTTITTNDRAISGIFGRVQMLTPGRACFTCGALLNPEEVRRDMMTAYERKLDPYIQDGDEPAPSVISINGTVVSLATTMLMAIVMGVPSPARHLIYNAMTPSLRSVRIEPKTNCYICSRQGVYAKGDSQALFARQD